MQGFPAATVFGGNVLDYNASRPDDGICTDGNARADRHIPADPHIVLNDHCKGVHFPVWPQLVVYRMPGGRDHQVGTNEHPAAGGDLVIVHQDQVGVDVRSLANGHGLAKGTGEGWFDPNALSHRAKNPGQHLVALFALGGVHMVKFKTQPTGLFLRFHRLFGIRPKRGQSFSQKRSRRTYSETGSMGVYSLRPDRKRTGNRF